ncbi:MAG: response regulator [Victivallales bacterium]|nr:response regulator [Victivallales bacterium]
MQNQDTAQKKILLCDDDDIFLKLCSAMIRNMGFCVLTARNGDEAIDRLVANPEVRLAIIDLLMPIRSGWEVIKYMKKQPELNSVPLIAITGLSPSPQDLLKVGETCQAVIHKGVDFSIEELGRLIRELA